ALCPSTTAWTARVAAASAGPALVDGASGAWQLPDACGQAAQLSGSVRVAAARGVLAAVRSDGKLVVALPKAVLRVPARVDFGPLAVGARTQRSLRLQVAALAPAVLHAAISGPDASEFSLDASGCRPLTRSCPLRVK